MSVAEAYKADGVNLPAGDAFSRYAGMQARTTWENSKFVRITDLSEGNFRGPRAWRLHRVPRGCLQTLTADGVGTKVLFHAASFQLADAGYDIVAMTGGDITRYGGIPLVFASVLDVASLGEPHSHEFGYFKTVVDGLALAADKNEMVVITGETAELGPCVGSENPNQRVKFNWAGVAYGLYHPDRMITGATMRPGHRVVALRERGFRSNGISSARKAFQLKFGPEWWDADRAIAHVKAAARRSSLYDAFLARANGWYGKKLHVPMSGLAHITGGGIPEKFGSLIFPHGLSATLDDLYDPPKIMSDCAAWRELDGTTVISCEDFYRTWNGGQGVLAVMPESSVDSFIELAGEFEHEAKVCGIITHEDSPELVIASKWRGKGVRITP